MKSRISIVIDASAFIALGLDKTLKLAVAHDESVIFYVTQKSLSEIKNYYEKRTKEDRRLKEKLKKEMNYWSEFFIFINDSELKPFANEAKKRIHDHNDWQEVALALKLGCAILTEDCDFLGAGVPTWTRATINHGLGRGQRT